MSSPRKPEEVRDLLSDADFEAIGKHVEGLYDIIKRTKADKIHKESEASDDVAKKLEHFRLPKILKLNVGGHLFTTSLLTMKKDPGSILHTMFSGRFHIEPDEDGVYFIDRDGTHFQYILNYLRTEELVIPDDKTVRNELLIEARFYQVKGIIKALTPNPPFEGSEILSNDQGKTLMEWLKDTPGLGKVRDKLLYRASQHGWNSFNFHTCCDDKGPTVTVIKSGNYIFGGYAECDWEAHDTGLLKGGRTSFLFSFVNPSGLPPTKIPQTLQIPAFSAIYCHASCGPTFGGGSFGEARRHPEQTNILWTPTFVERLDLYFASPLNSGDSSTKLGTSYLCPPGENNETFLTGSRKFFASEIEVFGFKK